MGFARFATITGRVQSVERSFGVIRILAIGMILLLWLPAAGCSQKGREEDSGATGVSAAAEEGTEAAADTVPEKTYFSNHDPEAFYTMADLPRRGSYLKLDFSDLTPEQLNRVVHRLKTEECTCGCVDDTIDECLVVDPNCDTAVQLVAMIVREEKMSE